jgi:S-adenosylmethionine:tRNA ribosyltransferase-isomerase
LEKSRFSVGRNTAAQSAASFCCSIFTTSQSQDHIMIDLKDRITSLGIFIGFVGLYIATSAPGLPPYIKHSPLSEKQKRQEYQAIFAKTGQAVAAPTASLHFTQKLIHQLKQQGIAIKFIRLDVGLGTFAPLKAENFLNNQLHSEYYFIDKATAKFLNQAKKQNRPILAVGTTVVRTLETASNAQGYLQNLTGSSNLFIQKDYKFKFINGLITNFHVPKSSLMMLVGSLVGRKTLLNLYQKAIAKNFRFFSFGDGMLIK